MPVQQALPQWESEAEASDTNNTYNTGTSANQFSRQASASSGPSPFTPNASTTTHPNHYNQQNHQNHQNQQQQYSGSDSLDSTSMAPAAPPSSIAGNSTSSDEWMQNGNITNNLAGPNSNNAMNTNTNSINHPNGFFGDGRTMMGSRAGSTRAGSYDSYSSDPQTGDDNNNSNSRYARGSLLMNASTNSNPNTSTQVAANTNTNLNNISADQNDNSAELSFNNNSSSNNGPQTTSQDRSSEYAPGTTFVVVMFKLELCTFQCNFFVVEGDWVVVQADRGEHVGRVRAVQTQPPAFHVPSRILRHASFAEIATVENSRPLEEAAANRIQQLANDLGLAIRIVDTEFYSDGNKMTVFFSSKSTVDFRELQRVVFREFRRRIWLINTAEVQYRNRNCRNRK
jgi:hypothetical protein